MAPSDEFFGGGYWQGARLAVLEGYGYKCMRCGLEAAEVHHIRPRHYGGKDHPRNLMPLCKGCHDEIHREIEAAVSEVFAPVTSRYLTPRPGQTTLEAAE